MEYIVFTLILGYIVISYLIFRKKKLLHSVSPPGRGTRAERELIKIMLKKGVHPKAIFHDLYLQKKNGKFAQIDIVVATPQGLLAIEVKEYSGWLFGNEKQRYWTQVLNYGNEKYRFYNPIMQNAGHIRALREQSKQFAKLPIFNVVLFAGDCTLKNVSYWTDNTFVGYSSDIGYVLKKVRKYNFAEYTDKSEVARSLSKAVNNGNNPEIVTSHIDFVQRTNIGKPQPIIRRRSRIFRVNWWRLIRF